MSDDLLLEILNDVSKWNEPLEEIIPVNYGELFYCQDWYMILKLIDDMLPHTDIVIPTNGTLLDEDKLKQLITIKNIFVINFSINAYLPETYKAFMGLESSNLERIKEHMLFLKQERPDINLWASMVYDPAYQSEKEKELFVEYWKDYAFPQIIAASNCGRYELQVRTTLPCRSIFSDIVVGFDRKLTSCCFDPGFSINLGEYSGDLKKDWHNPQLEELRRLHNEGFRSRIIECFNCSFS